MSRRSISLSAARRAFTLIELLLVLVILAVLAAVVVPNLIGRGEKAKVTATIADIQALKSAVKAFETDTGRLPNEQEGLAALVVRPTDVAEWHGPYVDKLNNDKWGTPYAYKLVSGAESGNLPFNIISAGKDMQTGTEDDLDIYSDN